MYIPTWVDMVLILPTFAGLVVQFRLLRPERALVNLQWLLMLVCVAMVFVTAFLNRPQRPYVSLAIFVICIAAAGYSVVLFRRLRRNM